MTMTQTKPKPTITFSNYRVEYIAPRYEDGKCLYDGRCAILADDAEFDGRPVRVFDVPDVDEGQREVAQFACEAMNRHEQSVAQRDQLVNALRQCVSFIRSTNELAKAVVEPHVLKLADDTLATIEQEGAKQ